jgi:threonine 3-dehydrogenase
VPAADGWQHGIQLAARLSRKLAMLESGFDIRKIITHRLPVAEFRTGFEIMQAGNCGKIVLGWAGGMRLL